MEMHTVMLTAIKFDGTFECARALMDQYVELDLAFEFDQEPVTLKLSSERGSFLVCQDDWIFDCDGSLLLGVHIGE